MRPLLLAAALVLPAAAEVPDVGPAGELKAPPANPELSRVTQGLADGSLPSRQGRVNGTPVREWTDGSGTRVVMGTTEQGAPRWLVTHEPIPDGGVRSTLDQGADGRVDRVVVNREKGEARRLSAENELRLFGNAAALKEEAAVTADLKPEAVKVYVLGPGGLDLIDFQNGEANTAPADKAAAYAEKLQGMLDGVLARAR